MRGVVFDLNELRSDGRHPNACRQISWEWYDAIVERDTLTSIEKYYWYGLNDTQIEGNAGVDTPVGWFWQ